MEIEEVVQGLVQFIPLIVMSVFAFWRSNAVLFLITAGIAIMTGLKAPDLLTGDTASPLSMSIGLALIAYAFVCVAFAYLRLFRVGEESGGPEN